jgi:hypothetical protein
MNIITYGGIAVLFSMGAILLVWKS